MEEITQNETCKENNSLGKENLSLPTDNSDSKGSEKKRKRANSGFSRKEKLTKVRTPSGTILTNTVKDIRNFFSPKQKLSASQPSVTSYNLRASGRNSHRRKVKVPGVKTNSKSKLLSGEVKRKIINKSKRLRSRAPGVSKDNSSR